MIYFMQPIAGGPVKIGFSDNVDQRRNDLERHYGCALVVLAMMEGGTDVESEIHSRFAHHRLGRTEQFRPGADLMAFIGRPLLVNANPRTVEAMEGRPAPVRLDLTPGDHERLERCARERGLNKSSYARQAVLNQIKADEREIR